MLDLDDKLYRVSIKPADGELFLGLVYYELHDTVEKRSMLEDLSDLAERIPELPPEAWWRILPLPGGGPIPVPGI